MLSTVTENCAAEAADHSQAQADEDAEYTRKLEIALKLHNDIYEECRSKDVDRFAKYGIEDSLARMAIQRVHSREGKRVPARFSIGYWKAWTDTRDILEMTSAKVKKQEDAAALRVSKKKQSKIPFKTSYKKPKKSAQERTKGLAFGPANAVMACMNASIDPSFQLPVDQLFAEHTKRPPPKDPAMLPKPMSVSIFQGGDMPGT